MREYDECETIRRMREYDEGETTTNTRGRRRDYDECETSIRRMRRSMTQMAHHHSNSEALFKILQVNRSAIEDYVAERGDRAPGAPSLIFKFTRAS